MHFDYHETTFAIPGQNTSKQNISQTFWQPKNKKLDVNKIPTRSYIHRCTNFMVQKFSPDFAIVAECGITGLHIFLYVRGALLAERHQTLWRCHQWSAPLAWHQMRGSRLWCLKHDKDTNFWTEVWVPSLVCSVFYNTNSKNIMTNGHLKLWVYYMYQTYMTHCMYTTKVHVQIRKQSSKR